jgi:Ca-activated chloride channel family protein
LIVFGHYWGSGEASVSIEGKVSGEYTSYSTTFEFPESGTLHPEIERLWAFAKIEDLQSRLDYFGADADVEQAITDLAIDYGLVTDYTSMIVLREERFDELGIKRLNRTRVENEQLARQDRMLQGVRNNRVDTQQPMSANPRASHGNGGGAFDPLMLLILLPLMLLHLGKRKHLQ